MKIKKYIQESKRIIDEISKSEQNISTVFYEFKLIKEKYLKKELSYQKFNSLQNKILQGKSKDEIMYKYKNYHESLVNKLKSLSSKIFDQIYNDKSFESLRLGKKVPKRKLKELPQLGALEISQIDIITKPLARPIKEQKKAIMAPPKPRTLNIKPAPPPIEIDFTKRIKQNIERETKPWLDENGHFTIGGLFSRDFLRYLFTSKNKKEMFGETSILPSILSFEKGSADSLEISKRDVLDPYLLEKQIKELKTIISKRKPEVYKASSIGYLANLTVRKISIYFIEQYPEFFKNVYKKVRYANIKILANTYINIVFFVGIITTLVSFPILTMFFAFQGGSFLATIAKIFGSVLGVCLFTFWMGFYYPNMQADTRKRSINSNLPFAIDHMSSVIASGVSPTTMFKLISHSREYGDISIEIEKVTNYITFFGYDILTALKAVAITTPSEHFKEFIDGFVSTIETGGDLKDYLTQKSQEALLNYRLERQKYVESLGTYSDIYTGVLIAAPLFFVTALSLVSVLGGTIGGMSVNTVITMGTYIAIPGLNLLFLIFLEINQPEI